MKHRSRYRLAVPIGAASLMLTGCESVILNPKGSIGLQEQSLIATSTWAMLLVVVPVIVLTLCFAWRYRASNRNATYSPHWSHSTAIAIVVRVVPTVIIVYLAVLTWKTTHSLDPYRPLNSPVKPIDVDVVALDWKWLFIYPDIGIASVNQLAVPIGTPINFHITSDSVMNSFFIPQLGGQIYAMAGMQTRLHLIADQPGNYAGMSANFSGKGFSDMKFRTLAMNPAEFNAWTRKVKASPQQLNMDEYYEVARPSEKNPVQYFSSVDPKLFHNIIAKYNDGHVLDPQDAACGTKG
jgi:cytochrome o ubiquinol oxidase subunit II